MADQSRKKERQRQKRKAKQEMIRKQNAVSPYKRVAEGKVVTCLVNEGWKEKGMANVHVLRAGVGGPTGAAVFLVDCWCAGLKDIWGVVGVSPSEYLRKTHAMADEDGMEFVEVPLEEAARIVAGGVRFAVQNGFRLPPHSDRWLPFVGPVDWQTADLSDFGRENGELLWMGDMDFLRRRLIGCTAEEFLKRPNVKYIMEIGSRGTFVNAGESDDLDDAENEEVSPMTPQESDLAVPATSR